MIDCYLVIYQSRQSSQTMTYNISPSPLPWEVKTNATQVKNDPDFASVGNISLLKYASLNQTNSYLQKYAKSNMEMLEIHSSCTDDWDIPIVIT